MKNYILLILFILNLNSFSQKKERIHFYGASLSPIGLYNIRNTNVVGYGVDVTFKYKNNYLALFALGGDEVKIMNMNVGPTKEESDYEISFLYGTRIVDDKIKFNIYAGMNYYKHVLTIPEEIPGSCTGYFFHTCQYENVDYSKTTIGYNIQAKINYILMKRLSLGIRFHANINDINNLYFAGILVGFVREK